MSMLRSIREKKGFTLAQLAGRAGISAKVLAEYEEGSHPISLPHAKLLAKTLWVGIEELIPPPGTVPPLPASASVPVKHEGAAPGTSPISTGVQASVAAVAAQPAEKAGTNRLEDTAAYPTATANPARVSPTAGAVYQGEPKAQKAPRVSPVMSNPITEGQLQELLHLALRLRIDQTQLEERIGKTLASLKKMEAKEWIKKLRGMADEVAPSTKVRYGQWPDAKEDVEALYLREQKKAGATFLFKLFNGETFTGTIGEFTAYTVTVKQGDEDIVLRKLAIAYYRRLDPGDSEGAKSRKGDAGEASHGTPEEDTSQEPHDHHRDDARQPLYRGINSDLVGTPDTPEEDNMDEDRGA